MKLAKKKSVCVYKPVKMRNTTSSCFFCRETMRTSTAYTVSDGDKGDDDK